MGAYRQKQIDFDENGWLLFGMGNSYQKRAVIVKNVCYWLRTLKTIVYLVKMGSGLENAR
jgi:hypothetical protein